MQDSQIFKISKVVIITENGPTEIDQREVEACKEFQINFIREIAEKKIMDVAPIYKQLNALSGSLSEEEANAIISAKDVIRNTSNALQQQVKDIIWDGKEETRIQVCDLIQAIRFE